MAGHDERVVHWYDDSKNTVWSYVPCLRFHYYETIAPEPGAAEMRRHALVEMSVYSAFAYFQRNVQRPEPWDFCSLTRTSCSNVLPPKSCSV